MNNHDRHRRILFVIDRLLDQSIDYDTIKNNENARETSNYFGLQAVKYNIYMFIFLALSVGLAIGAYIFFQNSGIWQGLIMIILAIAFLPYAIMHFILALNCDIKQIKLNKLAIGRVSLIFTLFIPAAAIAAIVLAILLLSV